MSRGFDFIGEDLALPPRLAGEFELAGGGIGTMEKGGC